MPSMRLPRPDQRTIFWGVFCGAFVLVAVLAVLGLRPASLTKLVPQPNREAAAARAGKMIYDDGSDDCQQVSFNNDTAEITDTRIVPCRRRPKKTTAPASVLGAGNVFGSMRKAFKGASDQSGDQ